MWPTYYGMTGENFPPGTEAPGMMARVFRFAAFGAMRKEVIAPIDGEVSALFTADGRMVMAGVERPGKKWLVFPTTLMEYTFYVGDKPATIRLPADFHGLEKLVIGTYFKNQQAFQAEWTRLEIARKLKVVEEFGRREPAIRMPLGRSVKAGESVIRFDLLTGDQLFVDRMSYHFVRPSVGQGFVFRTGNIPGIRSQFGDQYYIKRLVGVPGDTLEIHEPVLIRNGEPITGAEAFAKNANREGKYRGYFNGKPYSASYLLRREDKLTVPAGSFFALGDNSDESSDGRYWGFVPAKDVAGRPLFIYFPFTRRWGPAR
jgi:signal peptidase I